MSKIVFDEPIVRIKQEKIRFPRICPVCTSPSVRTTRVTTTPGKKQYLNPTHQLGFTPSQRRRLGLSAPQTRTFLIPVCEDHYFQDASDWRFRAFCVCFNGLFFSIMLFATFVFGSNLSIGRGISYWYVGLLALFILSLVVSAIAFKPKPIQKAIQIVGFDPGLQYVWLKFKNSDYRDQFIEENAMDVELVKWVIKSPPRS